MDDKKKRLLRVLGVSVVLAVIVAAGLFFVKEHYVFWNGSLFHRQSRILDAGGKELEELTGLEQFEQLEEVDLRGTGLTVSQYEILRRSYPGLTIRWEVPFQGSYYSEDTQKITVTSLTEEDIAVLDYLPLLTSVDAWDCPDTLQAANLQRRHPECKVFYNVSIDGKNVDCDVRSLSLQDVTAPQLEEYLTFLPRLEEVDLGDSGLSREEKIAAAKKYPQVFFRFPLTFGETTVYTDAAQIDISGETIDDVSVIEEVLPCFPNLERVIMCRCGIDSEAMDALQKRHPEIRFVWSVNLAGRWTRTDELYFTPNKWGLETTDSRLEELKYCVDMVCVDVGHHPLTHCEWVSFMPNLKYLIIADTGIKDLTPLKGLKNLVFLELFQSRVKDYSPLLECPALEDLNLCYTYGEPEPVSKMTWLKRLWWDGSWKAAKLLPQTLTDTEMNFDSGSSTGGTWRQGQHYYDMRDFIGMGYMIG